MNLSAVRNDVERLTKTALALSDSENLVQEMSTEVRTISHLLHPPLLDEAGLLSALRWYVDGFAQRSKIKVDLDLPDDFGRLPRESETAIFRIIQECLTNIHRHSGSSVARIPLSQRDQEGNCNHPTLRVGGPQYSEQCTLPHQWYQSHRSHWLIFEIFDGTFGE